jgi:hypothetical protein
MGGSASSDSISEVCSDPELSRLLASTPLLSASTLRAESERSENTKCSAKYSYVRKKRVACFHLLLAAGTIEVVSPPDKEFNKESKKSHA